MSDLSPEVEAHDTLIRQAENCHWVAQAYRSKLGEVAVLLGVPSGEVVESVKALDRLAQDMDDQAVALRRQAGRVREAITLDRRSSVHQDDHETILDVEVLEDLNPDGIRHRAPLVSEVLPEPTRGLADEPAPPKRSLLGRFVLWLFGVR